MYARSVYIQQAGNERTPVMLRYDSADLSVAGGR